MEPKLEDLKTWTERLGHSKLRTFTDKENRFWVEQNAAKRSRWAKLARDGHEVAWEFEHAGGGYTGRMLVDGTIYAAGKAAKKFPVKSAG